MASKPVNKKDSPSFVSQQFRVRNYGPYTGRTQSFQQYSVSKPAADALIKRSS